MTSKVEYLKKYLSNDSGGGDDKTNKKKKKIKKLKNVVIHDDDLDWKNLTPQQDDDDDEDPEDAPIVIDITDDRPEFSFKWKAVQTVDPVNLSIVKVEKDLTPSPPGSRDMSPRRRNRRHDSPDLSPRRRNDRDSSPDFSPPRQNRRASPRDFSPPRRKRPPDNTDQVGSKRIRERHDSPDVSPPRRRTRHDSGTHEPDLNPPRRNSTTSQPSTTTNKKGPGQRKSRFSPPRRDRHGSPDLSPLRERSPNRPSKGKGQDQTDKKLIPSVKHEFDKSPLRKSHNEAVSSSPPTQPATELSSSRTLLGSKVGLQSADSLKDEIARANAERERFIRSLDPLISGRQAETVYRDKEGRRIDPKTEKVLTEEEEKKKKEDDAMFAQWGRGVAQVQSAQEKHADDLYEMSKPLARYRDDEDLERLLKEREREGDPMLAFMKKKNKGNKDTKNKKKPKKEKPTYQGSWPQNRFGVRPGYRWDGIDRSNGYENTQYALKAEKKAQEEFAYKWSVEDM